MSKTPIIIVTGLGRCGSTMMMQMLKAGGIEPYADHASSLECSLTTTLPYNHNWLNQCEGKAVKVLDVWRWQVPSQYNAKFIWLQRNLHEQAKSQVKFMTAIGELPPNVNAARLIKKVEKRLAEENIGMYRYLSARPFIALRFEEILQSPLTTARSIGHFIGSDLACNTTLAASAVFTDRPTKCASDLNIELILAMHAEGRI